MGKQSRRLSREREQNTAVTGVSKEVQERGWFSDGMVECSGGRASGRMCAEAACARELICGCSPRQFTMKYPWR